MKELDLSKVRAVSVKYIEAGYSKPNETICEVHEMADVINYVVGVKKAHITEISYFE